MYSHTYTTMGIIERVLQQIYLSPEPLEDGGFYSESPSYVFSLLDIKRARSPISLKGTSAIKMCFIIKPETILSLFSPKWKEQGFF